MTEPVWLDGTQDPPPQPTLPDPLAGLLTGEVLPGALPERRAVFDVVDVPTPPPVAPGIRAALAEPPRQRRRKQPQQAKQQQPKQQQARQQQADQQARQQARELQVRQQQLQVQEQVRQQAQRSAVYQPQPVNQGPTAGFRPAPAYRPQAPRQRPKSKPGASVISWLVLLFILFLIARSVIENITGH